MKHMDPWHRSILKYTGISILLIIAYMLIFIFLIKMEQQSGKDNILTAFYWVISTITTVGYGDVTFNSNIGRMFSVVVMLTGVVMIFGILFSLVVTPMMERMIEIKYPSHAPADIENHIIICGYNKLVETLIDELEEQDTPFLIVETNEDTIRDLIKKGTPCIFGNPADEDTLNNANIRNASFLIANRSDEENANIVLTAREVCDTNVIAIVEDMANAKYLRYAGANRVISPKSLYGRFIGVKAIDPFISRLTGTTEFFDGLSIIEFPIYPRSQLIGKTIMDAEIHERTGANIVGMWKGGTLSFAPDPYDMIKENSVLLATGTTEQLSELKKMTK